MASKTLDLSIPHNLGRAEARRRVESVVAKLDTDQTARLMNIRQTWNGDRMDVALSAMGQEVTGWLDVEDEAIRLHIVLPWLLAKLADTIRPRLEREARRRLRLPPKNPPGHP